VYDAGHLLGLVGRLSSALAIDSALPSLREHKRVHSAEEITALADTGVARLA